MRSRLRQLWRRAEDPTNPANYPLAYRPIEVLGYLMVTAGLTYVALDGIFAAFIAVFTAFILGWQYHWLMRVRAIRKESGGDRASEGVE